MITANQLREMYLDFFREKTHKVLPSFSLIPHADPTLLLTGAGMVPLKPYFLGEAKPESPKLATCQKCIRTGDLENVGKTTRHLTFFEMLGNFSFGDYFKAEIIPWAWEFVIDRLKLPKDKIWITVYLDDDEAFDLWVKQGQPKERIVRLGKPDNFWELGVGPCGPNSEIYLDLGEDVGCKEPTCNLTCECGRFLEFWNLVFIQFHKDAAGNYIPLKQKGIDTGMGLERMVVILQGVDNVFEIDSLRPIVNKVASLAGTGLGQSEEGDAALRVISDHARAMMFMVSDGIMPSNEGRGYVLRRVIRRAVRYGKLLGIQQNFLTDVVAVAIEQMKDTYPELLDNKDYIFKIISLEEKRFQSTLDLGLNLLENLLDRLGKQEIDILPGEEVFKLYDTYGFPKELTEEIAGERGFEVDSAGFEKALENQREMARRAHGDNDYVKEEQIFYNEIAKTHQSEFVGYDFLNYKTKISAIIKDNKTVDTLKGKGVVILEKTPFYAEKGGQVGDTGFMVFEGGKAEVLDVKTPVEGLVIHFVNVTDGVLKVGTKIDCEVDRKRRLSIARNHTATHILHRSLKQVLGEHVNQAGSFVEPDRFRFDFSHYEAPSKEQLRSIEELVNAKIRENLKVGVWIKDHKDAKELNATALFEEKYGDKVRIVGVGDYSKELCGGTHVNATGEIGLFKIIQEGNIAAGIRRIEAVTGESAYNEFLKLEELIQGMADAFKTGISELPERLKKLDQEKSELERQITVLEGKIAASKSKDLLGDFFEVGGVPYKAVNLENTDARSLRNMADNVKDRLDGVLLLAGKDQDKAVLLCLISKQYVAKGLHAGKLIKEVAGIVGGSGGGRPDNAQAGGSDTTKLKDALEALPRLILAQLG